MAQSTQCDKCGAVAVSTAEFTTSTTTTLKFDLCEADLAALKNIMRVFSGQDIGELKVTEEEVRVNPMREMERKLVEKIIADQS